MTLSQNHCIILTTLIPTREQHSIVFVHGLMGDRVRTWTSAPGPYNETSVFWPQDLLPEQCPSARILSFGYNAAIFDFYPFHGAKSVVQTTVNNHSTALVDDLLSFRSRTATVRAAESTDTYVLQPTDFTPSPILGQPPYYLRRP